MVERQLRLMARQLAEPGVADVVGTLATAVPMAVITHLLGIPREDHETLGQFSHDMVAAGKLLQTEEQLDRADIAADLLKDYFLEVIRERRQRPQDDLISHLVAVPHGEVGLREEDLWPNLFFLFPAGHVTTGGLIAGGVLKARHGPGAGSHAAGRPPPWPMRP